MNDGLLVIRKGAELANESVMSKSSKIIPELQFYSIPKRLDRRNKLLASIRKHHWQLTFGQKR